MGPQGYSPSNCRWETRIVQSTNQRLLQKNNTTGYRGISKNRNRWKARIAISGNRINLGAFGTPEEAALAYNNYVVENKTGHPLNVF